MEPWLEILKTFGPSIAFMAFTVWRDYARELRMSNALDSQGKELMLQNTRGITAIEQNTASNNRLADKIDHLPCRAFGQDDDIPMRRSSGPQRTI